MDDRNMKQAVQRVFTDALSGVGEDPCLAQRVLAAAQPAKCRRIGKPIVAAALVLALVLAVAAGVAWTVSRQYFAEIAHLTLTSGDYADWSAEEKRYLVQCMGKYGLIPEGEARKLARRPEADIDAFMLARYGAKSAPGDLGWISLTRIADVELGTYAHWPNETWVWFTNMMLDTGAWQQNGNMDMYYTPGDEAVPPEEAVESARQHLLEKGISKERLDGAQIIWHYMTDGADSERQHLSYWVTFVYPDQSEDTVRVLKDGETSCTFCRHGL